MDIIVEPSAGGKSRIMSIMEKLRVGVVPLPVYLVLAAVVVGAVTVGKLPKDMIGGFAIILTVGILLGHLGQKIPILNKIGGAAILCLFVPSALVYFGVFSKPVVEASNALMKTSNFLYVYIACLVVGSILGMNRKILIQGFIKMFIPLIVGTIAAVGAGVGVAMLFGYNPWDAYLYIVTPIIGGGIGEGILPLSMSYGQITGQAQESYISQLIPAALLGNIVAIVCAGLMKRWGDRNPKINGNGLLVRTGEDKELLAQQNAEKPVEFPLMASGLLMACVFFIFGLFLSSFIGIPGPIIMIFAAAIIKALNIMPPRMEQGAHQMYKFMTGGITYPLLVGLGIGYVPFGDMVSHFTIPYFIICITTVLAMMASGFFVGKLLKMYEMEAAIVTGCHSGLGGTGDVAILSASDRMNLMPFAQISTRIGGAVMVVIATMVMKAIHG